MLYLLFIIKHDTDQRTQARGRSLPRAKQAMCSNHMSDINFPSDPLDSHYVMDTGDTVHIHPLNRKQRQPVIRPGETSSLTGFVCLKRF